MQEVSDWIYRHILFFLPQEASHPWDYVAHFIVSSVGSGAIFLALLFPLKAMGIPPKITLFVSAGLMLTIGVVKEINDKNFGKTDMAGDMISNIFGITVSVVIILLVMKIAN